jgi:hypothetical protein
LLVDKEKLRRRIIVFSEKAWMILPKFETRNLAVTVP